MILAGPNIVEYEEDEMKLVFDPILGIKIMHESGIILHCKKTDHHWWTHFANERIDGMTKFKAKMLSQEPKSTEEATQCVITSLDAN